MEAKVASHHDRGHWKVRHKEEIPPNTKVLPAVWSMKRKRRIATREIYKWKARLNVHGGKQEKGVHFWETYSPVVKWFSIRFFLLLALLKGWRTRQIDFVLAYPQAPVETPLYMKVPKGFTMADDNENPDDFVLELVRNLYGQKQAGRVWNKHLHKGLIDIGFQQSSIDECVYYKGSTIFLVYVDDGLFFAPTDDEINAAIADIRKAGYDISDEGEIDDYLGVKIERVGTSIRLTQPHLITQLLQDTGLENAKRVTTPALVSAPLERNVDGPPHNEAWHYRSVIGKLNFLEKSTRPDIAYAVHQCARFSEQPKENHSRAVKRLIRYLGATRDRGLILQPESPPQFDCYVDADFCGNWDRHTAHLDPITAKSRTGYVIRFAGCPLSWGSRLQTETALSTTEAEYIALSTALREVIPLMALLREVQDRQLVPLPERSRVHCKVFEDNSGALEMARMPKMRPRTKHINVKMHHFREHVANGDISIHAIGTLEQLADIFTKPLGVDLFTRFREAILGW